MDPRQKSALAALEGLEGEAMGDSFAERGGGRPKLVLTIEQQGDCEVAGAETEEPLPEGY